MQKESNCAILYLAWVHEQERGGRVSFYLTDSPK